jgi:hypothetical protein
MITDNADIPDDSAPLADPQPSSEREVLVVGELTDDVVAAIEAARYGQAPE